MKSDDGNFWMKAPYRILFELTPSEDFDPWKYNMGTILTRFLGQQKMLQEINLRVSARALYSASRLHRSKTKSLLPKKPLKKKEGSPENHDEKEKCHPSDEVSTDNDITAKDSLPLLRPPARLMTRRLNTDDLIQAIKRMNYARNRKKMKQKHAKIRNKKFGFQELDEARTNIERLIEKTYNFIKEHSEGITFLELIPELSRLQVIRTLLCLCYLINRKKIIAWQAEGGEIIVQPTEIN